MDKKLSVPESLLRNYKTSVTYEEIVLSPRFRKLLSEAAYAILTAHNRTRRLDIAIYYDENDETTAYTDDYKVVINAGNEMFLYDENKNPISTEESVARVMGAFFHELGHVLYTCFSEMKKMVSLFSNGKLIVLDLDKDMEDSYNEMQELLVNDKACVFTQVPVPVIDFVLSFYMSLNNCIEDGREERRLLENDQRFSGFDTGLKMLRDYHKKCGYTWNMPFGTDSEAIVTFTNLCLMYAKYGCAGTYTGGFQAFEDAKPIINEMLECNEARKFAELNFKVLLCIWPTIKKLVTEITGQNGSSSNNASKDGSGGKASGQDSGGSQGQSSENKNTSQDASGGNSEGSESSPSNSEGSESSGNTSSSSASAGSEGSSSEESSSAGSKGSSSEESSENSSAGNQKSQEEIEKELEETLGKMMDEIKKHLKDENTSLNDADETEEKENEVPTPSAKGGNGESNINSTIDQIKRDLADQKARDVAQAEACKTLSAAIGRGFAEYHGTRVCAPTPVYYSDEVIREVDRLSGPSIRKASAEIRRHLERDMRTGTSKRKMYGNKFHAEKLVNRDFRYFENKKTKKDMPKVRVGLLVDESGSMNSHARYKYARAAAITLYELFENIPNLDIAIYGHSTHGPVEIYNYTDFGIKQKDVKERLSGICARGGNIDIIGFTALAENLLKQDAEERLMIVITDGLPYSYVKEITPEQELSQAADNYTRKGIDIIVASIGDDESRLRNIYKNQRFLDISDPADLPKKLVQVIKRKM